MNPCKWHSESFTFRHPDGFVLKSASLQEAEDYLGAFREIDPEVLKLTASPKMGDEKLIKEAYLRFCSDPDRAFFLLENPTGEILGEAVINELDRESAAANFRIALFVQQARNHGLGTWITEQVCCYAFDVMRLETLSLDVLQNNPRARHVYEKTGFVHESFYEEETEDFTGNMQKLSFEQMVLHKERWFLLHPTLSPNKEQKTM